VSGYKGRCPAAFKVAKSWHEEADVARTYLDKATKKMKKWADEKRRHLEFNVGDMVLVKINPSQHKMTRSLHKGLVRRYDGPFQIIKKVGNVSYKVDLPPRLKIHPVFHVSYLKPYHQDKEDPFRESWRPPFGARAPLGKEVERIISERLIWRPNYPSNREYLVKWKGLPESEN